MGVPLLFQGGAGGVGLRLEADLAKVGTVFA